MIILKTNNENAAVTLSMHLNEQYSPLTEVVIEENGVGGWKEWHVVVADEAVTTLLSHGLVSRQHLLRFAQGFNFGWKNGYETGRLA